MGRLGLTALILLIGSLALANHGVRGNVYKPRQKLLEPADNLETSLRPKLLQLLDNNAELVGKILSYLDSLPSSKASRFEALAILKNEDRAQSSWRTNKALVKRLRKQGYGFIKPVIESVLTDSLLQKKPPPNDVCSCDIYRLKSSSLTCCHSCCEPCLILNQCYNKLFCIFPPPTKKPPKNSPDARKRTKEGRGTTKGPVAQRSKRDAESTRNPKGANRKRKNEVTTTRPASRRVEDREILRIPSPVRNSTLVRDRMLTRNILSLGQMMRMAYNGTSPKKDKLLRLLKGLPTEIERKNYNLLVEILASFGEPIQEAQLESPDKFNISLSVNVANIDRVFSNMVNVKSPKTKLPEKFDELVTPIDFRPIANAEGLLMVAGHLIRRIRQRQVGCPACTALRVCQLSSNNCSSSCYPDAFACSSCPRECPAYPEEAGCPQEVKTVANLPKDGFKPSRTQVIRVSPKLDGVKPSVEKNRTEVDEGADKQLFDVVLKESIKIKETMERKKKGTNKDKNKDKNRKDKNKKKRKRKRKKKKRKDRKDKDKWDQEEGGLSNSGGSDYEYTDEEDWGQSGGDSSESERDRKKREDGKKIKNDGGHKEHEEEGGKGDEIAAMGASICGTSSKNCTCGLAPMNKLVKRIGTSGNKTSTRKISSYMINGYQQKYGSWPFYARVTMQRRFAASTCGGAIISERHILTAAHCTVDAQAPGGARRLPPSDVKVVLGDHYVDRYDKHEKTFAVKTICTSKWFRKHNKIFRNPKGEIDEDFVEHAEVERMIDGNDDSHKFDFAVLELEEAIEFNKYYQPACLPVGKDSSDREDCYLVGAGVTEYIGELPILADTVEQMPMERASCRPFGFGDRDSSRECYTKKGSIGDSCNGDSGGPILCFDPKEGRWEVEATVSYGSPLCDGEPPFGWVGVYARVRNILPVIKNECGI